MKENNATKRILMSRKVTLVFLILGSFLAFLAIFTLAPTQLAAPRSIAKPAPTPTLDQEAAAALVEELKETLSDSIEDEDAIESIKNRWDARVVSNRTRKQIIDMLFQDVKSIVKEKETQDAVWASWSEIAGVTNVEEPGTVPVTPKQTTPSASPVATPRVAPTGITKQDPFYFGNDEKIKIGHDQMVSFFGDQGVGGVKTWAKETGTYGRQTYSIYKDMEDPDVAIKVAAVHKSVKTLIDRGVRIPNGLSVYCAKHTSPTQQRAIIRGEKWAPVAIVFLVWARPRSFELGSLSQEPTPGFDRATISMIHEIGHILHERSVGDLFWMEGFKGKAPDTVAAKVSMYARNSRKEFAAEVFAGMLTGKKWSPDVMASYREMRGPDVP